MTWGLSQFSLAKMGLSPSQTGKLFFGRPLARIIHSRGSVKLDCANLPSGFVPFRFLKLKRDPPRKHERAKPRKPFARHKLQRFRGFAVSPFRGERIGDVALFVNDCPTSPYVHRSGMETTSSPRECPCRFCAAQSHPTYPLADHE